MSRRLLASYLSLALAALVLLEVPLGITYARNQRSNLAAGLARDATYVASVAAGVLANRTDTRLRSLALRYAEDTDVRVAIVDTHRRVVVESSDSGSVSAGASTGLVRALTGHAASGTAGGSVYAAAPVFTQTTVTGAVLVSAPASQADARIRSYELRLLAIAGAVLGLVALVGWLLARSVVRPLRVVEEAANRAGRGDLAARAPEAAGPPEVRSLARSFNDMVSRLERLLGAQEEFVADASHQLRTPLTALRLRLETEDTAGALAEVDRLTRLVDDLLALSRAEVSAAEEVDLPAMVGDRLDAWRPVAEERGIRLEATARGTALVSPDRLSQVLDNLIANAIAVAPPGTVVSVAGDAGELHVRDGGPGMTDADRARAFDRFWSKAGGSGLGLPIVRRLLAADGGTVELRAANGGGLDVVIGLRPSR